MRTYAVQGPFGVRAGSLRDPYGIHSGSARGPCGLRSGSVRDPLGLRSGSIRDPKTHINDWELTLLYQLWLVVDNLIQRCMKAPPQVVRTSTL